MGKKQAAPKRRSDQALAPAAAELPESKRARKQADPAQQLDQNGKSKLKAEQKPKAAAEKKKKAAKPKEQPKAEQKPKKRQSKRSKKQQQEEDEEDLQLPEEEEQLEEEQDQGESEKSVHDVFMEEVHAKEQELQKHCLIMGQVGRPPAHKNPPSPVSCSPHYLLHHALTVASVTQAGWN
jgi:hypothetical protein